MWKMTVVKIYLLLVCVSFISIEEITGVNQVCYSHLGCLPLGSPWYTWLRPLPAPQAPDVIATAFHLYTRQQPARYYVTKLPDISVAGADYDGSKPTFFITHGFLHDGNHTWINDMKDSLLKKLDANVIVVDWGRGADNANYFQVASNIRVVAAEITRLCKFLIESQNSNVSKWHLIGHSLGAHIFSYVAKAIPGIARLTALDPAQPAFEGYQKEVRLDATDALFVEVIHTNARPFIPLGGVGMVQAYGHVDFYMNGGKDQPGCITPPPKLFTWKHLVAPQVKELIYYVGCPHMRSYIYFTASIRENCTFWGRRVEDLLTPKRECGPTSCSPLGLDTVNYPGRGSFHIATMSLDPFCFSNKAVDATMSRYRTTLNDYS